MRGNRPVELSNNDGALEDRDGPHHGQYRRVEAGLLDDEACFATRLQNLWEYLVVARDDPILPSSLLPADWPRPQAQSLCEQLQRMLTEPAERFFVSIYEME